MEMEYEKENFSMDFQTFIKGINVIVKGTLKEKLQFYFELHDQNKDGRLDKNDFYLVIDAVTRFYFYFYFYYYFAIYLNFHIILPFIKDEGN